MWAKFWADQKGQDLVEYSLLLAFIMLASAALTSSLGTSASGIWGRADRTLTNAVTAGNP